MTQQRDDAAGRASRMEILLADDDAGHATLIKNNLRDVGLVNRIHHFADGQAVLDFLSEATDEITHSYLLLLDIRMPMISGIEVLRRIKDDARLRLLPVIMLSTTDDPGEIRKCHELGCNEYITKPVEYDQFVEVIRRLGLFLQIVRVPELKD